MCEWLLSGEWCDVQILCNGHVFTAHRTVLASVSTFLREILLSSSTDESQTFIILPDFEIEAMSSVLYYIYHGEAHIKSKNFLKFYEILKCLQIYIDDFCFPKDANPSLKLSEDCFEKNSNQDQTFVRIKKISKDVSRHNSLYASNLDQGTHLQSWNGLRNETLRNLQSTNGDRQRSLFHVGSFVSTYHWNGNSNGGGDSVLAISNESYRAPSVPMMNINAKHLSVYEALPESRSHMDETLSSHSPKHPCQDFQKCNEKCDLETSKLLETYNSSELENNKLQKKYKNIANNLWMNFFDPFLIEQPSLIQGSAKIPHQPSSLDLSIKEYLSNVNTTSSLDHTSIGNDARSPTIQSREITWIGEKHYSKPAILNKVLDSPWRPHMTYSTKPFRRKQKSLTLYQDKNASCDNNVSDNNNNIDISAQEIVEKSTETDANILSVSSGTVTSGIDKDDMKCRICDQVFLSKDLRNLHMKSHDSNGQNARYTCVECEKSFSQLRNYKYHMSVHRGTREFAATCTICGKYFNDKGYLSSHMKIHRNRKEYKCSVCPKSFNQRVAYNMHVRIHTGVKPHVCSECGKAFSRKMLLKQHHRTHSGERPYACPHCDKRFADRSNMTLHLRLHTGVKPFSCSLCSKSFTKKHHLKSHLNFHTGAKPYSCPRCSLAFTQSSNMRTHYKKCTGSKLSSDNLLSE